MRITIIASLFHVPGYHAVCPKDKNRWYRYQQDKKNETSFYKPRGNLPVDVRAAILQYTMILQNKKT